LFISAAVKLCNTQRVTYCGSQPSSHSTCLVQRCDTHRRGHSPLTPSIVDLSICQAYIQKQNLMSSRVTRSAARRSTGSNNSNNDNTPNPPPPPPPPAASSRPAPTSTRKRKTAPPTDSPEQPAQNPAEAPTRGGRAKRSKVEPQDTPAPARSKKAKGKTAMSSAESVPPLPPQAGHGLTVTANQRTLRRRR
jgi:hypothetical protein